MDAPTTSPPPAQTTTRQDRCPGCGSDDYVVEGPPGAELTMTAGGRQFVQPAYEARRCRSCGLVFKSAVAAPGVLADYYAQVDHRRWDNPDLFPTEEAVIAVLNGLPAGAKVLDFGCSTGRLLSRVADRLECYGFEINLHAAEEARRKRIRMLLPDDVFRGGPRFDAIVLVDVVEHLTEPTVVIQRLAARLQSGGLLVLSTGNADSPAASLDLANFWYFRNVEHLCMITRAYAGFLADELGMDLVRWETMSHYRTALLVRWKEAARVVAYDSLHGRRLGWLRPLLSVTPVFRRAKNWPHRPLQPNTMDHVLVALRKR